MYPETLWPKPFKDAKMLPRSSSPARLGMMKSPHRAVARPAMMASRIKFATTCKADSP